MAINVKIIGTDEDVSGATALLSTLATKTGYSYKDVLCYTINRQPVLEANETEYLGSIVNSTKTLRYEMEIQIVKRAYSSTMTATTDDTFYPEIKILKKPYLWVYSSNYKVGFATANTAIKVSLDSLQVERKGRYITLTIKTKDSYAV